MTGLALLPVGAFAALWAAVPGSDVRRRFLVAALTWGVLVAVITEGLSATAALTRGGVSCAWLVVLSVAAACAVRHHPAARVPADRDGWTTAGAGLAAIAVILTGLVAWCAPPNTWDSMTYHMSRVAHWAQQGSVAFYPTHIPRQLVYNPWAEWAIAQLYVLAGSDRWANGVQWGAFVGSLVAVSAITAVLGGTRRAQAVAAVVCATIPMAILQASSTQNDLVVSFWVASVAYWVVRFGADPTRRHAVAVGASLGLALLTKVTAVVFAAPFVAWFLVVAWRQPARVRTLATVVGIAIALNAGHVGRCGQLALRVWRAQNASTLSGPSPRPSPTGNAGEGGIAVVAARTAPGAISLGQYFNRTIGVRPFASNLVRNLSLHAGTPWPAWSIGLERFVHALHRSVGADANDPRTTYPAGSFRCRPLSRHEDTAGNPLHLLAVVVAVAVSLGARHAPRTRCFAAALVAAALLFCMVFKWQPWHSRLHLPLFVLGSALVGLTLDRHGRSRTVAVVTAALFVAALPYLFSNSTRPVLGDGSVLRAPRGDQYFAARPDLREPYRAAAARVVATGCRDVGVFVGGNDWEYPFWVLLGADGGTRIGSVAVDNPSALFEDRRRDARPCAVLATRSDAAARLDPEGFAAADRFGAVQVFLPRTPP